MTGKSSKPQDLSGLTFGRWKVLRLDYRIKTGHRRWICCCSCGVEKSVYGPHLTKGESKSCGCLQRETARTSRLGKFNDLIGKRFGKLRVIDRAFSKNEHTMWNVKCDCGKFLSVRADSLSDGKTTSCRCIKAKWVKVLGRNSALNLAGRKFGRLTVVGIVEPRIGKNRRRVSWWCLCDCGNIHIVTSSLLTCGNTKSCGCWQKEEARRRMTNPNLTDDERRLNQERRSVPGIREWRKSVYEKDSYICSSCGYPHGGNLVAHHKESWATNRDLRLVVQNGATTCEPCHNEFHTRYGRGGNTEVQWQQFVVVKRLITVIDKFRRVATDFGAGDVRGV